MYDHAFLLIYNEILRFLAPVYQMPYAVTDSPVDTSFSLT